MARAGPKKTQRYGVEFKQAAVQLSHRPGRSRALIGFLPSGPRTAARKARARLGPAVMRGVMRTRRAAIARN